MTERLNNNKAQGPVHNKCSVKKEGMKKERKEEKAYP